MARKQHEDDAIVLGDDDARNYADALSEMEKTGQLQPGGKCVYFVQLFTVAGEYVCAYFRVDGPLTIDPITKETDAEYKGADYSWRKWIYIDEDWNERTFQHKLEVDDYIASRYTTHDALKGRAFSKNGNKFVSYTQWTLSLAHHRSAMK